MNKFKIEITLNNGITDTSISSFNYKDVEEFYENLKDIRENNKYLKFKIDEFIVEYNFDDISLIKIHSLRR